MRALDPEVVDAVWAAVEPLVARPQVENHPLGCHRRRVSDRVCFEAMLIRLVTGCSWVDAERLVGGAVSDTTLRARRDEWEKCGVIAKVVEEALHPTTRSSGSTSPKLRWTAVFTRPRWAGKAPAKVPWTGENQAGSGPF